MSKPTRPEPLSSPPSLSSAAAAAAARSRRQQANRGETVRPHAFLDSNSKSKPPSLPSRPARPGRIVRPPSNRGRVLPHDGPVPTSSSSRGREVPPRTRAAHHTHSSGSTNRTRNGEPKNLAPQRQDGPHSCKGGRCPCPPRHIEAAPPSTFTTKINRTRRIDNEREEERFNGRPGRRLHVVQEGKVAQPQQQPQGSRNSRRVVVERRQQKGERSYVDHQRGIGPCPSESPTSRPPTSMSPPSSTDSSPIDRVRSKMIEANARGRSSGRRSKVLPTNNAKQHVIVSSRRQTTSNEGMHSENSPADRYQRKIISNGERFKRSQQQHRQQHQQQPKAPRPMNRNGAANHFPLPTSGSKKSVVGAACTSDDSTPTDRLRSKLVEDLGRNQRNSSRDDGDSSLTDRLRSKLAASPSMYSIYDSTSNNKRRNLLTCRPPTSRGNEQRPSSSSPAILAPSERSSSDRIQEKIRMAAMRRAASEPIEPLGNPTLGRPFAGRDTNTAGLHLEQSTSSPGAYSVRGSRHTAVSSSSLSMSSAIPTSDTPSDSLSSSDTHIAVPVAAHIADGGEERSVHAVAAKLDDVVINLKSLRVRLAICTAIFLIAGVIAATVLATRKATKSSLTNCMVEDRSKLGDGKCDGGEYNSAVCSWDNGDCLIINQFPNCDIPLSEASRLGDGFCDGGNFFTISCDKDAGDCSKCNVVHPHLVGDGKCDGGEYNTIECSWDGGDCLEFNEQFPDCEVSHPSSIGDGECSNVFGENSEECGWDGGDCLEFNEKYPLCNVPLPSLIGDGQCVDFDSFPSSQTHYISDNIMAVPIIGEQYNTEECGWDGNDCLIFNKYPDCTIAFLIDSVISSAQVQNEIEESAVLTIKKKQIVKSPQGGLMEPNLDAKIEEYAAKVGKVGDGSCDMTYFSSSCGFDDGDCEDLVKALEIDPGNLDPLPESFRSKFPNCEIWYSYLTIGDGKCDGGPQNSAECGWDGSDCIDFNAQYQHCNTAFPWKVGNGRCDSNKTGDKFLDGIFPNVPECGYDGGDCLVFNERFPDCYGTGDCSSFYAEYPECLVDNPGYIGDGICDKEGGYNTESCQWDGGDCLSKN